MKPFRAFITETVNDLVAAHTECAEAGVPLPDKDLNNLRRFHNGWQYDTEHGYIQHNTTAHGSREPGAGYITHHTKNHILHREDGPAVIHSDGAKIWTVNGQRKATYSPITKNNTKEQYWHEGKETTRDEFVKHYGEV